MTYNFNYLITKILKTKISNKPFRHIKIKNFFNKDHFKEIINSNEILLSKVKTDTALINLLEKKGFKSINFPGSITYKRKYINWHSEKKKTFYKNKLNSSTEGFGYVLRLYNHNSLILKELNNFFSSKKFLECVKKRFKINDKVIYDGGIQKYLDGYEISPHPDVRRKAATWMININPFKKSNKIKMHTQYLYFKKEREYVQKFWEGNPNIERAWVPWSWAKTAFEQDTNNSIVLFSPNNSTMHAVKANYDHLKFQRTQIYGNLWYSTFSIKKNLSWKKLDLLKKVDRVKVRADKGQGLRKI